MAYHHEIKPPDIKHPIRDISGNLFKTGRMASLLSKMGPIFGTKITKIELLSPEKLSELDDYYVEPPREYKGIVGYRPYVPDAKWYKTVSYFDYIVRILDENKMLRWNVIDTLNDVIIKYWYDDPNNLWNIVRELPEGFTPEPLTPEPPRTETQTPPTPEPSETIVTEMPVYDPPFEVVVTIKRPITSEEETQLTELLQNIHNVEKKPSRDFAKEFKEFLLSDEELLRELLLPIVTNTIGTLIAAAVIAALERRRGKKPFIWTKNRAKLEKILCSRPPLKRKNLDSVLTLTEAAKLMRCNPQDIKFLIMKRKLKAKIGGKGKPYQIRYGDLVKLQRKYYR